MRTIETFYGITQDLSEQKVREYEKDISPYYSLAQKLEKFAELDSAYLRTWLQKRKYKGRFDLIRMLEAHGDSDTRKWLYADLVNEKVVAYPVSEWVDLHEGKYDILFVSCCNPGKVILSPRKSVIVYPLGKYKGEINREVVNGEISDVMQLLYPPLE